MPDELSIRLERELRHDARRELVDRVEALREQREERAEVDRAQPQQRRREQQREVETLAAVEKPRDAAGDHRHSSGTALALGHEIRTRVPGAGSAAASPDSACATASTAPSSVRT